MAETIKIGGELESVATGGIVAAASAIKDKTKNRTQEQVNAETDETLAAHSSAISGFEGGNFRTLVATDADADIAAVFTRLSVTPAVNTIYRIANWKHNDADTKYNTAYYSEYAANGTTTADLVPISLENKGIDDVPTAGSENLIKSGGVKNANMNLLINSFNDNFFIDRKIKIVRGAQTLLEGLKLIKGEKYTFNATIDEVETGIIRIKVLNNGTLIYYKDIVANSTSLSFEYIPETDYDNVSIDIEDWQTVYPNLTLSINRNSFVKETKQNIVSLNTNFDSLDKEVFNDDGASLSKEKKLVYGINSSLISGLYLKKGYTYTINVTLSESETGDVSIKLLYNNGTSDIQLASGNITSGTTSESLTYTADANYSNAFINIEDWQTVFPNATVVISRNDDDVLFEIMAQKIATEDAKAFTGIGNNNINLYSKGDFIADFSQSTTSDNYIDVPLRLRKDVSYTFSLDDYPIAPLTPSAAWDGRINFYYSDGTHWLNNSDFTPSRKQFTFTPDRDVDTIKMSCYSELKQYTVHVISDSQTLYDVYRNTSQLIGNTISRVPVIFDTDWGGDVDDLTAMGILAWAEREGIINLVGIVSNRRDGGDEFNIASCLDAQLSYHGLSDVSFGINFSRNMGAGFYNTSAMAYRHTITSQNECVGSLEYYRRVLSFIPEGMKMRVMISNHLVSFEELLKSPADTISPLTGAELVAAKVDKVWIVGGHYPNGTVEWNFAGGGNPSSATDVKAVNATYYVLNNCPVPMIFLGSDQYDIHCGNIILNDSLTWSFYYNTLRQAFTNMMESGRYPGYGDTLEEFWRNRSRAWDTQLAMCVCQPTLAMSGYEVVRGTNAIITDTESVDFGKNIFTESNSGNHYYVKKLPQLTADWFTHRLDSILKEDGWNSLPNGGLRFPRPSVSEQEENCTNVSTSQGQTVLIPNFTIKCGRYYTFEVTLSEAVTTSYTPIKIGNNILIGRDGLDAGTTHVLLTKVFDFDAQGDVVFEDYQQEHPNVSLSITWIDASY